MTGPASSPIDDLTARVRTLEAQNATMAAQIATQARLIAMQQEQFHALLKALGQDVLPGEMPLGPTGSVTGIGPNDGPTGATGPGDSAHDAGKAASKGKH